MYLKDNHIHMQRVSHVLVSHMHGDHFFGLVGLLSSMHLFGRSHPLTVYGPPELEHVLRYQFDVGDTVLNYQLNFVATQAESPALLYEDNSILLYSFPLKHSVPTTGFLFREKRRELSPSRPKSFAYCSDTQFTESIVPYVREADLLYHESTFLESEAKLAEERFHSTAAQAAKLARMAEVKRLMLGHYSARYGDTQPFLEEAMAHFPETVLAYEGLSVNV